MQTEKQINNDSNNEVDLRELWFLLLENWKLFALSVFFTFSCAVFYIWFAHPSYKMTATVLVGDEASDISQSILDEVGVLGKKKNVENEIAIISSRFLMYRAVSQLDLNVTYIADLGLRYRELYANRPFNLQYYLNEYTPAQFTIFVDVESTQENLLNVTIEWEELKNGPDRSESVKAHLGQSFSTDIGEFVISATDDFRSMACGDSAYTKSYVLEYCNNELVTTRYMEMLNVEAAREKASILELTLKDRLKLRGEDVLNKLLEVYIANSIEKKNLLASNALLFIDKQLSLITNDLGNLESEIQQYKTTNRISDVGSEAAFYLNQVGLLDKTMSEIDVQISFVEYLADYVSSNESIENATPASLGIQDPILQQLLSNINQLSEERESLLKFTKEDNPLVQSLDVQLKTAKQALLNNIFTMKNGLVASKQQVELQQQALETKMKGLPKAEYELLALQRKYSIKESLYLLLLEKRSENAIILASTVSDNFVLDKARGSEKPIDPKRGVILLFALVVGIAMPFLWIMFISLFDTTLKSKNDIKNHSSIPLLGIVPHKDVGNQLVVSSSVNSPIAESFRSLRTNIGFVASGTKQKSTRTGGTVIQLTSSFGSEGKSFCSINIAASLAMAGGRTIIVGLDLRKPKLAEYFNLSNATGTSTVLAQMNDWKESIVVSEVENLDILVGGPIPPNPSELLLGEGLSTLIEELREKYNYIILDTPPIGLVSDSLVIAKLVDASIYVVRQGVTHVSDLDYINDLYSSGRVSNVSILFNDVKSSRFGYGYGYGYGYYENPQKPKSIWSRIRNI